MRVVHSVSLYIIQARIRFNIICNSNYYNAVFVHRFEFYY